MILTATSPGKDNEIVITENATSLNFADKQIEAVTVDEDNSTDYAGTVTSSGTYTGTENTSYVMEIITEGAADGTAKYRLSTDGGLTFDDNGGLGYAVTSGGPVPLANGVNLNFEDNGTLRVGDLQRRCFQPRTRILRMRFSQRWYSIAKSTNSINDVFEGLSFNIENATTAGNDSERGERLRLSD